MPGAREENNTEKPRMKDSRFSMWYYYSLLSGTLLMVGGLVGTRYFRLPRSSTWSLLCITTSVTGMYLTISSIHRLYNSLRDSVSEEAENADSSSEASIYLENVVRNIKENPLQITECTKNNIAEDDNVKYASDDNADVKPEILSDVVTDMHANSAENNDINDDLSNLRSSSEDMVFKCESTKHILDEEITEDCIITQNLVAGDIKDDQVVANNALEEVTAKNIICENIVEKDIVSESNPIENIDASESIEENVKVADIEETIPKDNRIAFLVAMDCVAESKDNQVAANEFLEDYNIKEADIEEVIPKDAGMEYQVTDNVTNEILDNDLRSNEFIEQDILKEVKMENVLDTDISIKNLVADVNVTESELDKNVMKILEEDIVKEPKIEVIAEKHDIIDDPLADDSKLSIEKDIKESEIEEAIAKNINIEFPVTEDCIIESNVNVMANEFLAEYNSKQADSGRVIAKYISFEESAASDNVIEEKLHKDSVLNQIIEEDSITKDENQKIIEKDITIKNPVDEDDVTESKLDKDAIRTREDDMVKGPKVEEIEVKYEIEGPLTKNDENKHKLNKETRDNASNEDDTKEDKIEDIAAKNIFEISVAEDNIDNSVKKIYTNKSNEKDIKEIKIEEATSMHVSIGNLLTEKDNTQRKSGKDIQTNEYVEEYITTEAEIEVIQKDISIEDRATDDVTNDKFNKDDLENEIFLENFIKEDIIKEVAVKDLDENKICESSSAKNIVVNESLEEGNTIKEAEIEEVTAKYISIEDTVVRYKVDDALSKDDPEEGNLVKGIFNQNAVADINKNSDDKEITACEINRPYIPVDETIPTKDPESQIEGEAMTDEQNAIRALSKEICTTVSQSEQTPKPSESTVATPIKQLVCTSTDEVGFLSPNTASGIGVFFRKSTRTRLAAQFPNTTIEPAKDSRDSKCSLSKQPAKTSVSNLLPTDQSLNMSSSVVAKSVQISQESLDSTIELCSERQTNTTDDNSTIAEYSPTPTNTTILASNRQSFEIVMDPNYRKSAETSKSSIVSLKDQTSDAGIVIGHSSRDSGIVVSLDQQIPKTERGVLVQVRQDILLSIRSPGLSDRDLISSTDESLGLLDTATISVTDSSPVVSARSVSIPSRFQKSSDSTAVSPSCHLPTNFSSPSGNSSRQSSKMPDRSVASLAGHFPRLPTDDPSSVSIPILSHKTADSTAVSPSCHLPRDFSSPASRLRRNSPNLPDRSVATFAGHSPKSPTEDAFLYDRHSPRLEDVDNRFRRNLSPSVGGVGHIRRASWSSSASHSGHTRLSFGRGIATHSMSSAGVSEEDVFSSAADSPWASCDNISQAGHSTKPSGKDVFSLARRSPWSSCGDVSSHARRSKRTKDWDVFSRAHDSPWVSGSGTIFHDGQSRKPTGGRPFSNPRHSPRASGGGGVPRTRHSLSASVDALPVGQSPSVPGKILHRSPDNHLVLL